MGEMEGGERSSTVCPPCAAVRVLLRTELVSSPLPGAGDLPQSLPLRNHSLASLTFLLHVTELPLISIMASPSYEPHYTLATTSPGRFLSLQ